jgi:hypothetical protein
MAPVEAGEAGVSEAAEALARAGLICLRRIEASLRRCCSSSWMFFSLDFCEMELAKRPDNALS